MQISAGRSLRLDAGRFDNGTPLHPSRTPAAGGGASSVGVDELTGAPIASYSA